MRKRFFAGLVVASLLVGCGPRFGNGRGRGGGSEAVPVAKIDRSGLTNVGTGPLDYSDPNLWLCRPGNQPNECDADLTATEFLEDGTRRIVDRLKTPKPAFDCFYVYPTVALSGQGNMQDFSDIRPELDPLLNQAAPFRGLCTVYAPLYRQVSLGGSGGLTTTGDPALAYSDVEAAFQYYLDNLNHGRKFVLMGHSQGTFVLTQLIQKHVDQAADLREQMISALLIGGGVTVPEGELSGSTFQNIPLCAAPGQTGCAVAYNSFAKEAPPPANSLFGRAPAGSEVACTAPNLLAENPNRLLGSYAPKTFNNPLFKPDGEFPSDVTTPFLLSRNLFRGACVTNNGFHYYEISVDQEPGDQRAVPPYRSAVLEAVGFGLHVADYNLPLDDLLKTVGLQAYTALH